MRIAGDMATGTRTGSGRRSPALPCRSHRVRWKKQFGDLGTAEVRELRQLREENRKLKTLVADLTLDKTILREALEKKF